MAVSSTLAFILSNVYYHFYEKEKNDARITETLLTQKEFIENDDQRSPEEIFNQIASLDFQLVVIKDGQKEFYGYPFRVDNLPEEPLKKDEIYHGIKNRPFNILITGFFDNETKNTVGTNITIGNDTYSVFMRPSVGDSMLAQPGHDRNPDGIGDEGRSAGRVLPLPGQHPPVQRPDHPGLPRGQRRTAL